MGIGAEKSGKTGGAEDRGEKTAVSGTVVLFTGKDHGVEKTTVSGSAPR